MKFVWNAVVLPKRRHLSLWLMLGLLAASAALGVRDSSAAPANVQPQLLDLSRQHPDQRVAVIVQTVHGTASLAPTIARLGGAITRDLHIINAVTAELPAGATARLAQIPGVRWVSLDGAVEKSSCTSCIDTTNLANNYVRSVRAEMVWNSPPYNQGQGIAVAVVDSGITSGSDFGSSGKSTRVLVRQTFNAGTHNMNDSYGHGTHVAGIIGGDGSQSNGMYMGIAPKVNLLSVKISDDQGLATESDVVSGLQWVNDNRATYNIKVVNLSLNSTNNQSYNVDPMDAAAEILWFNGVVVVTSAGNTGAGAVYPPANDPFVITVGAVDDKGTLSTIDDTLTGFSAYGRTTDGYRKPDVVAPGKNMVSTLPNLGTTLASEHPGNVVGQNHRYFRMSGTSMAAPVVSGIVALLLQNQPTLTPDQVKYRLITTARPTKVVGTGAGLVDAYNAVFGTSRNSANTGIAMSRILGGGTDITTWNSASWGSASWGSASWGSASWGSASWGSDYWGP